MSTVRSPMINEEPGAFPWKEKPQVVEEGEIHLFPWAEIAERYRKSQGESCPQNVAYCGQPKDDDNARP
jgi:hypothetical protein